ncbi:MAG: hypothetical protein JWM37_727 [Candidatus Saccharibacteria bacterium]|nr:hypothetical protein [Candidatus Saccharibacteria bacterium]
MLEAFFTRQRKRSLTVLVLAISLIILGGSHTAAPSKAPQALQTVSNGDVDDTSTAAPSANRPIKAAQTIDNQAVPDTAAPSTAPTDTTATPSPGPSTKPAPAITLTQGKIERQETTDGSVTYTVHYGLSNGDTNGSAPIHAKLSTDVACDKGNLDATYTYSAQNDLTLSCTYSRATWQALPADITFKLDVSTESTVIGSLTYHTAK